MLIKFGSKFRGFLKSFQKNKWSMLTNQSILNLVLFKCTTWTPRGSFVSTGKRREEFELWNKQRSKKIVAITLNRDHQLNYMQNPGREHKRLKGTGQGSCGPEFMTHSQGASQRSARTHGCAVKTQGQGRTDDF